MVNSESIRSFSSYGFKGFSGKRQSLCRAVVAELSVVACVVPSVSVIHKALPGTKANFSFDKEAKMPLHSVPVYTGFQNIVIK